MQGQGRSSIGALPENLFFDNGSIAGEPVVASQMPWNSPQTSEQSWPAYPLPMNPGSFQHMQQSIHGEPNSLGFCLGESSSSAAGHGGDHRVERKPEEDTWNFSSQTVLSFENQHHIAASNALSLGGGNNTELNSSSSYANTNGRFFYQTPMIGDLNASSGVEEDDDCQVVEPPKDYTYNYMQTSIGSSSNPIESQLASRKRKAREIHLGQSSGEGSSNFQFHTASSNTNMSLPRQLGITIGNGSSEPSRSRLRVGVNEAAAISSSPLSLTASVNVDTAVTSQQSWVNGSTRQSLLQPGNSSSPNIGNIHGASSSLHSSRLASNNPILGLNPSAVMENAASNLQGPQAASYRFPMVPRDRSRWSPASASRHVSSPLPEQSNVISLEEYAARNVNRPLFLPAHETLNLNQNPTNTNWAGGNVMAGTGNLAPSSSRAGPSRGSNSSETTWTHQAPPQNRRRLSEVVQRSPLPPTGLESGGQTTTQNGPNGARSNQAGLAGLSHRARSALLGRRLNAAVGLSRSLRAFSAGEEGRSGAMPEHIRRILDMMRRGEGLRFEDMLILDQSAVFAMADIHDSHRDMRMDVDNMSYEELLALEERIGDVCTGLTEESIMKHMKLQKYSNDKAGGGNEAEPCSICREEYNEGEDVGKLECGHDFHRDCIKQWLMQKNLCPICKTTGLNI